MKIEDFGPRMQKLIRWINKVESRLEKRARARGPVGNGGIGALPLIEVREDISHPRLDWGLGRSSPHPAVQRTDPGWNDQFGA